MSKLAFRLPISYIDRSREYYQAQGFDRPYEWATNAESPFMTLFKPVSDMKFGLATTSSLFRESPESNREPKKVFAKATNPAPTSMYTNDLFWDKNATHTNDLGSFLPLSHLETLATDGVIGSVSERFYGMPTVYSSRLANKNAAEVEELAKADGVEAMILVPL